MVRSGGVLACVDADNGKLLYRDRLAVLVSTAPRLL